MLVLPALDFFGELFVLLPQFSELIFVEGRDIVPRLPQLPILSFEAVDLCAELSNQHIDHVRISPPCTAIFMLAAHSHQALILGCGEMLHQIDFGLIELRLQDRYLLTCLKKFTVVDVNRLADLDDRWCLLLFLLVLSRGVLLAVHLRSEDSCLLG